MQLLYPNSRQFPFDAVCEQIVRALRARNWKVPGFMVKLSDYGSGEQKLRYVRSVASDQSAIDLGQHDVKISFGRPQGLLPGGRFADVAAVCEVRIASRSLRVYEDESGPTYSVYVGDDWERDRDAFWERYNARLDNLPRKCVRYSGWSRQRNLRAAVLEWMEDHREYGPAGDEPRTYRTDEIMEGVRVYLQDVVLPAIEAHAPAAMIDEYVDPPRIPMPVGIGPFFTYGNGSDVYRIARGKECVDDLTPADRYGMLSSGWRLAPIGIRSGDDLPEVAFDGFLWCGLAPEDSKRYARSSDDQLIKVIPRDARGIYVADNAVYEKLREERAAAIAGVRREFTDKEVNSFIRARACTIVPITEYAGNYEDPVYLVNRELRFDEVEVISPCVD